MCYICILSVMYYTFLLKKKKRIQFTWIMERFFFTLRFFVCLLPIICPFAREMVIQLIIRYKNWSSIPLLMKRYLFTFEMVFKLLNCTQAKYFRLKDHKHLSNLYKVILTTQHQSKTFRAFQGESVIYKWQNSEGDLEKLNLLSWSPRFSSWKSCDYIPLL